MSSIQVLLLLHDTKLSKELVLYQILQHFIIKVMITVQLDILDLMFQVKLLINQKLLLILQYPILNLHKGINNKIISWILLLTHNFFHLEISNNPHKRHYLYQFFQTYNNSSNRSFKIHKEVGQRSDLSLLLIQQRRMVLGLSHLKQLLKLINLKWDSNYTTYLWWAK